MEILNKKEDMYKIHPVEIFLDAEIKKLNKDHKIMKNTKIELTEQENYLGKYDSFVVSFIDRLKDNGRGWLPLLDEEKEVFKLLYKKNINSIQVLDIQGNWVDPRIPVFKYSNDIYRINPAFNIEVKKEKYLKVVFVTFTEGKDKTIAFQVVDQRGLPSFKDNGFVRIISTPAIGKDYIYLRGDSACSDLNVSTICSDNPYGQIQHYLTSISFELFGGCPAKRYSSDFPYFSVLIYEWKV